MLKTNKNQQEILKILLRKAAGSSSEIHAELAAFGDAPSLVTVKRELSSLKKAGLVRASGAGRSVSYSISAQGRMISDISARDYIAVEPDKRFGLKGYNFELFDAISDELFSDAELAELNEATNVYVGNTRAISKTLEEKELERFIIELSWKSSKIEGNTYTFLDTERLLEKGIEAKGHDKQEALMILNHKEAFKFIRSRADRFKTLSVVHLEEVHKLLVAGMNVSFGLREKAVGVTGSAYRPLDNVHQIREAVKALCEAVNRLKSPYAKAMLALLGVSYIQPFEDGNKRTSRLIANALLLAYDQAPLSYRSVDENEYREAVMVFYELNSIVPFKKIFIEQYIFGAKNYALKNKANW